MQGPSSIKVERPDPESNDEAFNIASTPLPFVNKPEPIPIGVGKVSPLLVLTVRSTSPFVVVVSRDSLEGNKSK